MSILRRRDEANDGDDGEHRRDVHAKTRLRRKQRSLSGNVAPDIGDMQDDNR
jgi:hypothetical protein